LTPLSCRLATASLAFMALQPSPQVVGLIDRIKRLVAEQRRLDDDEDDRRDANRREISHLKWRLANAVRRELGTGPGLQPVVVSSA
jgi:hypothetical protein